MQFFVGKPTASFTDQMRQPAPAPTCCDRRLLQAACARPSIPRPPPWPGNCHLQLLPSEIDGNLRSLLLCVVRLPLPPSKHDVNNQDKGGRSVGNQSAPPFAPLHLLGALIHPCPADCRIEAALVDEQCSTISSWMTDRCGQIWHGAVDGGEGRSGMPAAGAS